MQQGPPRESFGIQTDALQLTLQLAPGSSLSEASPVDKLSPVSEVRQYASLEEASEQGLPGSLASAAGRALALRLEDCVGSHRQPGQVWTRLLCVCVCMCVCVCVCVCPYTVSSVHAAFVPVQISGPASVIDASQAAPPRFRLEQPRVAQGQADGLVAAGAGGVGAC